VLSQLWSSAPGALGQAGFAAGDEGRRVLEAIAYFYGVGAAITALAGIALGRLTLRAARDVDVATPVAAEEPAEPRIRTGRFDREPAPVVEPEPEAEPVEEREPVTAGAAPVTTTTRMTRRRGGLVGKLRGD
jgi:hypothetical protein